MTPIYLGLTKAEADVLYRTIDRACPNPVLEPVLFELHKLINNSTHANED